jgi:hypothetical protein
MYEFINYENRFCSINTLVEAGVFCWGQLTCGLAPVTVEKEPLWELSTGFPDCPKLPA